MIHINLLGEKPDYSAAYTLQLCAFCLAVILTCGVCYTLHDDISQQLGHVTKEKADLEIELLQLKKITKKVENLEKDKKVLKEKLVTIAKLKAKKHGPVHILDEIAKAIPEKAWLLALKEKSGALEVHGIALDNQTVASLMSSIEKSIYFESVDLVHSTQKYVDDVKLKEFMLRVKLNDLLSIGAEVEGRKGVASKKAESSPVDASGRGQVEDVQSLVTDSKGA